MSSLSSFVRARRPTLSLSLSLSQPTGRTYAVCKHNYSQMLTRPQATATLCVSVCVCVCVCEREIAIESRRVSV